jgi:hypothetical protein
MFVLVTGSLWRDPIARMSKGGKQFVTALIKVDHRAGSARPRHWPQTMEHGHSINRGPESLFMEKNVSRHTGKSPIINLLCSPLAATRVNRRAVDPD